MADQLNKEIYTAPDTMFEAQIDSDVQTEEFMINMGPQHPSTHGVLRVVLRTDGELVLQVRPQIGYLHRCKEKIGQSVTYKQYIPYTDRLDYVSAMNNNLAFALAVEKLAGIEVPERADYIRVIFAELNRIASHLVTIGSYALDMGAWTPLLYCYREREHIMDMFEATCGARLTYSYITVGGVAADLPENFVQTCRTFLDYFEPKIKEYDDLLSHNHIFVRRTADVGICPPELAIAYGLTGPCLRGSGVKWDLRKVTPYCRYDQFDFDIPVGQGQKGTLGDCWDRYIVRVLELEQSIRIIRQALDQLPDGPITADLPRKLKVPAGEIYFEAENPRGQLGFYIESQGQDIPYRVKCRGPSFNNLSVLEQLCRNCLLADVTAVVGSIDVVMGEVDR